MSACSTLNNAATSKRGTVNNPFVMTQGITFRLKNRVFKSAEDGGGPFVLAGFTGRSQMRVDPGDLGTAVADFTVTNTATTGLATVVLDASLSLNLITGIYVFDIEYVDDLDPENIISGTGGVFQYIRVLPGVTKP